VYCRNPAWFQHYRTPLRMSWSGLSGGCYNQPSILLRYTRAFSGEPRERPSGVGSVEKTWMNQWMMQKARIKILKTKKGPVPSATNLAKVQSPSVRYLLLLENLCPGLGRLRSLRPRTLRLKLRLRHHLQPKMPETCHENNGTLHHSAPKLVCKLNI
jgi:hypothetical protein